MLELFVDAVTYVVQTLYHNGAVLILGILTAAALTVHMDPERLKRWLQRKSGLSIGTSVAFGAFTPFCACGTMAVVLSMMTTVLPWGPVMAFLTSSPLMSPDEFLLYAGIVDLPFAAALATASVLVGLISGTVAHWLEANTGFFEGQARASRPPQGPCCEASSAIRIQGTSAVCAEPCQEPLRRDTPLARLRVPEVLTVMVRLGVKQVLPYFVLFAVLGFLINRFVPVDLIRQVIGNGNVFSVPLLAVAGLPLYVNGSSVVPLIDTLLASGASRGTLLAFLITGPGTSAGVMAGLLTLMRSRALALYVALLLVSAILVGYGYDLLAVLFS